MERAKALSPGDKVCVTGDQHRAGQYGEISNLPAPSGCFYVRIAPHEVSRDRAKAQAALKAGRYGATSALLEIDLEAA